jgi:uncharacterized membrane protein
MVLPIGFGGIFLNNILLKNLHDNGLQVTASQVPTAMILPALGMLTGLLIAVFFSYRKPRDYAQKETLQAQSDNSKVVHKQLNKRHIFIAIIAMILPGVSGAFLLLLLGSYKTILGSISGLLEAVIEGNWSQARDYFVTLFLFAIGCVLGLKVFSKILTWLFKNQENLTLALLTGFMIGSLNKLWPWKEVLSYRTDSHGEEVPFLEKSISPFDFKGEPQILYVILLTVTGFLLILILEKWANKKTV